MISCKGKVEILKMEKATRVVQEVLAECGQAIAPGVSTEEIDRIAAAGISARGARAAFPGYRGYPKTICVSVNDEVVHGIPSPRRKLKEGDIVGLDLGAIVDGYFGDSARTFAVGRVSDEATALMTATRLSLEAGIAQCVPGHRLYDIGAAVQAVAEGAGFSVVREYVGHGIGRQMHEEPQVPNFVDARSNQRLRPGMTIAIEPMVNAGRPEVKILKDGWTVVTQDGSLSAHFEHTVLITEGEPEILTWPSQMPSKLRVA